MLRSALVLSLMMSGCALYVRPITTLTPDDHVLLELNDQGIPDMAPKLGSGTFLVAGRLERVDSTSLQMSVYRTASTHAFLYPYPYAHTVAWGGETVAVPKFDVASARVERPSGFLIVGISLAAIATGITSYEIFSHAHLATQHLPPAPTNPFPTPIALRAWPRL